MLPTLLAAQVSNLVFPVDGHADGCLIATKNAFERGGERFTLNSISHVAS